MIVKIILQIYKHLFHKFLPIAIVFTIISRTEDSVPSAAFEVIDMEYEVPALKPVNVYSLTSPMDTRFVVYINQFKSNLINFNFKFLNLRFVILKWH